MILNIVDPTTFNAQTIATILLIERIVAVILIAAVFIKQIQNYRNLRTDYPAVRMTVMILTLTLLVGQAIPVLLDSVVAFGSTYAGRTSHPNLLAVSYSLNNATKDVIIGALLCFLYFRPGAQKR